MLVNGTRFSVMEAGMPSSFRVQFPPITAFKESLSLVNSPVNCFRSLLSSCLYFAPCSCDSSWFDDSASHSLRELGQILCKIPFSYLQDSMMDFCMATTLSTVLDNGTLNRTACDSSLFRRSSARQSSFLFCFFVVKWRSTLPTCTPSALLWTRRDGTGVRSLPVVSPVLCSCCGSCCVAPLLCT